MEIWDAYLPNGTLAGCDLVRGEPIPECLRHLVSEMLVRHTDGDYLLMQRDPRKPNYGGFFEATAGGSALKGENALSCAMRELREETGIDTCVLKNIGRFVSHDTIYEIFLCVTDCKKDSVTFQEGETISDKWVGEANFIAFENSDAMIDVQFQRYKPYLKQKGYVKQLLARIRNGVLKNASSQWRMTMSSSCPQNRQPSCLQVAILLFLWYNSPRKRGDSLYEEDTVCLPRQYLPQSHGGVYYERSGSEGRCGGAV